MPALESAQLIAQPLRHPGEDQRRCAACGGDDFTLLCAWPVGHARNSASIPLGFWRCSCQLAYLHPVPTSDQLPDQGDWWTKSQRWVIRHPRFKRLRGRLQNWLFGNQRQRLIAQTRRAIAGGTLLDIGCGRGELLVEARRFYNCTGLEPSPIAAAEARRKGFAVIESTWEEATIASETFDVVTLDAVLEHVVDPVRVLEKVRDVLRPRGVVAIKVPKLNGFSHRRHGREWNGFRVGYHLVMFDGKTLAAVLRRAGFTPVTSPRRDRPLDDILIMWGRRE